MTFLSHEKSIYEIEKTLEKLKEQNSQTAFLSNQEIFDLESKLSDSKKEVYTNLKPWDRVTICRHPQRPHGIDYIKNCVEDFVEIFGDRTFHDDHAIITGFGKILGQKFMIIAQEKGSCVDSRLHRNFGMPHPEGYRKALRCMKLAAKFNVPVVCLLDTPGAFPGLSAEERGQGWAIARNLFEMSRLETQILVIVIGEGCSGGALGIGLGDTIAMLENSYYSVISPEGCASILWKDASKKDLAAATLKMQAEDLLDLDIIDKIIQEPLGGAHKDPERIYNDVQTFIHSSYLSLKNIPIPKLIEMRYNKFRKMGKFEIADHC